ncbi:MAG: hypothetical protein ACYS5V_17855 [Planctomycetota bacterium]
MPASFRQGTETYSATLPVAGSWPPQKSCSLAPGMGPVGRNVLPQSCDTDTPVGVPTYHGSNPCRRGAVKKNRCTPVSMPTTRRHVLPPSSVRNVPR